MKPKSLKQLDDEADERETYLPWTKAELTPERRAQLERERAERKAFEESPEGRQAAQDAWDEMIVGWAYWLQLRTLSAQEFCILRHIHDPRKFDDEREHFPGGEDPSLGQRVEDDLRLIAADPRITGGLRHSLDEWVAWAKLSGLACPHFLQSAAAQAVSTQHADLPATIKPGIKAKQFIAKYSASVKGGERYLNKWFAGTSRKKGEKPRATEFRLFRGRYDEERMLAALRDEGRYSQLDR
jgi:hypothetical protein